MIEFKNMNGLTNKGNEIILNYLHVKTFLFNNVQKNYRAQEQPSITMPFLKIALCETNC